MSQLTLWVFVLGIAVYGAAGRSLSDSMSEEDVGIIGGDEVDIMQFPYQVALVYQWRQICGGSIISEEFVLTASHCVEGKNMEDFKIRTGSSYRNKGGVLYDVATITQHPQYNKGHKFDYDIAVIRIAGKINFDENTEMVQLANPGSVLKNGENMTVSGWGYTSWQGNPSNVLKAATLPFVDEEHCKKIWINHITDRMICAGEKDYGQSPCRGDSGGPLVDKNYVQYGIVSFGEMYCSKRPIVFANVANLRPWIKENTGV